MRLGTIALLASVALVVPSNAQDDSKLTPEQRWEQMAPGQRELLRDRFLQLLQFSPEERERLREEGRRIERRRALSMRGLSERERILLDEQEPDLRRRIVRELFRQRSLDDGSRVRDKLPPRFLHELEEASPSERGQMFRDFLRERRLGDGRRLLSQLGSELGLSEEERAGLVDLTVEEQGAALLELGRRFIRVRVAELGPPAGLGDDEWKRVDELDDDDFFEIWRRLGPPSDYLPKPTPPPALESAENLAPDPASALLDERPGVALAEERKRVFKDWRELRQISQLEVSDFIKSAADSGPYERLALAMVRGRTLEYIKAREMLDDEPLEALEALEGRKYLNALRRITRAHLSNR